MGIDGCSVPTFALPLAALAGGFARLGSGEGLPFERTLAARRLLHACFAEPLYVAGEGRFDTIVLRTLAPSCFIKGGAEGVHCAALPELGLGIALKIDDGAKRAAELVMSELLAALLPEARHMLADQLGRGDQELEGHRCRPRRSERGAAARSCAAHDAFDSFLIRFEA